MCRQRSASHHTTPHHQKKTRTKLRNLEAKLYEFLKAFLFKPKPELLIQFLMEIRANTMLKSAHTNLLTKLMGLCPPPPTPPHPPSPSATPSFSFFPPPSTPPPSSLPEKDNEETVDAPGPAAIQSAIWPCDQPRPVHSQQSYKQHSGNKNDEAQAC
jgi:hypothetical protein